LIGRVTREDSFPAATGQGGCHLDLRPTTLGIIRPSSSPLRGVEALPNPSCSHCDCMRLHVNPMNALTQWSARMAGLRAAARGPRSTLVGDPRGTALAVSWRQRATDPLDRRER